MRILGVSAHYHDAAAALIVDGLPVAAVQEERLSRRKNDAAFPLAAIEWCLEQRSHCMLRQPGRSRRGRKTNDTSILVHVDWYHVLFCF